MGKIGNLSPRRGWHRHPAEVHGLEAHATWSRLPTPSKQDPGCHRICSSELIRESPLGVSTAQAARLGTHLLSLTLSHSLPAGPYHNANRAVNYTRGMHRQSRSIVSCFGWTVRSDVACIPAVHRPHHPSTKVTLMRACATNWHSSGVASTGPAHRGFPPKHGLARSRVPAHCGPRLLGDTSYLLCRIMHVSPR